jgi:hypothetical protein
MSDVVSKSGDPRALAARLADERPEDIADALNRNRPRFEGGRARRDGFGKLRSKRHCIADPRHR